MTQSNVILSFLPCCAWPDAQPPTKRAQAVGKTPSARRPASFYYGSAPKPVGRQPHMRQHWTISFHDVASVRAAEEAIRLALRGVPGDRRWCGTRSMGSSLAWHAFNGFDVGVVFCPLIDVGVAILATGTQISRNLATGTSISWKAGHGNAKPGESRHTDANPEERNTREPPTATVRESKKHDLRPQVLGLALLSDTPRLLRTASSPSSLR